METIKLTKEQRLAQALSTIGFATGIYLAYKGKKKFWTYVGYSIGLSLVGYTIGRGIGMVAFGTVAVPTTNGNTAKVNNEAGVETATKLK